MVIEGSSPVAITDMEAMSSKSVANAPAASANVRFMVISAPLSKGLLRAWQPLNQCALIDRIEPKLRGAIVPLSYPLRWLNYT